MRRTTLAVCGLLAAATTVAMTQQVNASATGPRFNAPVKITPTAAGGYEPGVVSDRFGNLYATAHKENAELVLSPDTRSSTLTRSMSWTWFSADHGKSWQNLPGPALGPVSPDVQNHNFGDEGDLAVDDAGGVYFVDTNVTDISFTAWKASGLGKVSFTRHWPTVGFGEPLDEGDLAVDDAGGVYFVDTNVTDISFTAWKATGLGKVAYTRHWPTVGFGEPLDDRPWVAAHLDGHVFYFGNEGNKGEYPLSCQSESCGTGAGPGRYTVYSSYDGGQTWDHLGISLADSGWCRPAAAPRSAYVYAFCGNDNGKLYSFVSANDGKTWKRYDVPGGYTAKGGGGFESYPTLQVLDDGSLVGSYLDPDCFKAGVPTCSHVLLFRSTNHGISWTRTDITPKAQSTWQMEYLWTAATQNGKKLGFSVYARPTTKDAWKVYGTTFAPGQKPVLTLLDPVPVTQAGFPEAPGDFLMSAFDPAGKLTVTWTRATTQVNAPDGGATGEGQRSLFRDIYSATTR